MEPKSEAKGVGCPPHPPLGCAALRANSRHHRGSLSGRYSVSHSPVSTCASRRRQVRTDKREPIYQQERKNNFPTPLGKIGKNRDRKNRKVFIFRVATCIYGRIRRPYPLDGPPVVHVLGAQRSHPRARPLAAIMPSRKAKRRRPAASIARAPAPPPAPRL